MRSLDGLSVHFTAAPWARWAVPRDAVVLLHTVEYARPVDDSGEVFHRREEAPDLKASTPLGPAVFGAIRRRRLRSSCRVGRRSVRQAMPM